MSEGRVPPGEAVIRELRQDDVSGLCEGVLAGAPAEEVAERVAEELGERARGVCVALVAESGDALVGKARLQMNGDTGWVFDVATQEEFRGQGIAARLLAGLAEGARRLGARRLCLHVRADNPAALRAYEKAGFRCAGADGMRGEQLRYVRELESAAPSEQT